MNIPHLEMQLEELYNDLEIIDMELLTATGDDRYHKLKLKKSILDSIRKLNDRLNRLEDD
jgi:hypothetical protein